MQAIAVMSDDPVWVHPWGRRWIDGLVCGHPIVVGRKTYDQFSWFSTRNNLYVLTHEEALDVPVFDVEIRSDACILGGPATFRHFWENIDRIQLAVPDDDASSPFPCQLDSSMWDEHQYMEAGDLTMHALRRKR